MEITNYKDDVRATRVGCLGSSDAKLIEQVSQIGYVPKSAMERLAVCKGIIEQEEIPETSAIRAGNEIEMCIYEHLKSTNDDWQSNVRWESKKFSKRNCKLIAHPDLCRFDHKEKTLYIGEVKTTRYNLEQTRHTYASQMYVEYMLGTEQVERGWKVKMMLVHYSTEGLDLNEPIVFEPERLTVKVIRPKSLSFNIGIGMDVINDFLETFTEYYKGDEVDSEYLPEHVKQQFEFVTNCLREIKEREAYIDDFKKKLYDFMCEKGIKNIKNDLWTISRVDATEKRSFDSKKYLEDMKAAHPTKTKRIIAQYTKVSNAKGYVTIKMKEKKDDE